MYLIECSFIGDNHVKPYKVLVSGGPLNKFEIEKYRCRTKEEALEKVEEMKKKYDNFTTVEHVYFNSPTIFA